MSMHDKARSACARSKKDAACVALIPVTDEDLAEVKDIAGSAAKVQRLAEIAGAGCGEGCGCSNGDATPTPDGKAIIASALAANQTKHPGIIDGKLR